jgi:hypothetical protein
MVVNSSRYWPDTAESVRSIPSATLGSTKYAEFRLTVAKRSRSISGIESIEVPESIIIPAPGYGRFLPGHACVQV